ncbi:MAG: geranylgeranylglycerol-phosphate geranylgeranyltransferase [Candidatus Thermoplasmatota archaeon]
MVIFSDKIWGFIRIIRPEITVLGMVCVYIGAVSAGAEYFSLDLLLAMIAVFLVGAGSMPFNDFFDYEIDKTIHPDRPLQKGLLKPKTAFWSGIIMFLLALFLSVFVNLMVFLFSVIGITLICLYEIVSKSRGFLGNVVVSFTTALAFSYGGAVVGNLVKPLFFTSVAFFIFLSREILMDVRDVEGDREVRVTLPVMIGRKKAVYMGCFILGFSMFFLYIPGFLIFPKIWYIVLSIPLVAVTLYSLSLPLIDVENVARTTDILRFSMIQGLVLFIFLIFL